MLCYRGPAFNRPHERLVLECMGILGVVSSVEDDAHEVAHSAMDQLGIDLSATESPSSIAICAISWYPLFVVEVMISETVLNDLQMQTCS